MEKKRDELSKQLAQAIKDNQLQREQLLKKKQFSQGSTETVIRTYDSQMRALTDETAIVQGDLNRLRTMLTKLREDYAERDAQRTRILDIRAQEAAREKVCTDCDVTYSGCCNLLFLCFCFDVPRPCKNGLHDKTALFASFSATCASGTKR